MMRKAAGTFALLLMAGCGNQGLNPIAGAVVDQVRGQAPGPAADGGAAPQQISRASVEAANVAAVFARLESDDSPTLMLAQSDNGGYVTYVSSFRQTVTMRGSQITSTRGLGTDLLSAWSSGNDPVSRPTPPSRWPASVERAYEFPRFAPQGRIETYTCTFQAEDVMDMTILGTPFRGQQISETCTGEYGRFENLHFVDLATGVVWRSLQWVGPDMPLIDLTVLEPYTGN
jgi:hypothetical protein